MEKILKIKQIVVNSNGWTDDRLQRFMENYFKVLKEHDLKATGEFEVMTEAEFDAESEENQLTSKID